MWDIGTVRRMRLRLLIKDHPPPSFLLCRSFFTVWDWLFEEPRGVVCAPETFARPSRASNRRQNVPPRTNFLPPLHFEVFSYGLFEERHSVAAAARGGKLSSRQRPELQVNVAPWFKKKNKKKQTTLVQPKHPRWLETRRVLAVANENEWQTRALLRVFEEFHTIWARRQPPLFFADGANAWCRYMLRPLISKFLPNPPGGAVRAPLANERDSYRLDSERLSWVFLLWTRLAERPIESRCDSLREEEEEEEGLLSDSSTCS